MNRDTDMDTAGGSDGSRREQTLLAAALERPMEERAAFLEDACRDDPALRLRVEALLAEILRR